MADQNTVSYVRTSLGRGIPLTKIRTDLYKAGWPKKDIEEAIVSASARPRAQPVPASRPVQETKSGKKMYIGIIVAILAAVGTVTYLVVLFLISPSQPICGDGTCNGQETYEICPADCPVQNMTAKVSVSPPTITADKGGNVEVGIGISSASNLYGFQFDMIYDPSILNYSRSGEGGFLSNNNANSVFCVPVQPKSYAGKSYITLACTRLGPVGGASGNGTLASVTFNAIGGGTGDLELANVKLVDAGVNELAAESEGGSVTVRG